MAETAQTRVTWRGVQLTARMRDALREAERRFQKKYPGVSIIPTQGSWSQGSLSGGTHSGAGAVDLRTWHYTRDQRVFLMRCLKDVGLAPWFRPRDWDGNDGGEHIHALDKVKTGMDSGARWQVDQYKAKRSGLRSNLPDNTYRAKGDPVWNYKQGRPVPRAA